jgi:hypothetical protein
VRVWGEPGTLPALAGGPWTRLNVEDVPGNPRLPALVLRVQRVDAPLVLRVGEYGEAHTVLAEQALIRVEVQEGGRQSYRASFLLGQLAGQHLDVELPEPAKSLDLSVTRDGKAVSWDSVDEAGAPSAAGHVARVELSPDLVRRGSVLEVTYQLTPGRTGDSALRTTLRPPLLRGTPGPVPTRWHVTVPPAWVTVAPESGPGADWGWARRGWLWAPRLRPGAAAEVERRFAESAAPPPEEGDGAQAPSLACWRGGTGPLVLTHVPQQAWLMVCSLGLLVLGLGLYGLTRPPGSGPAPAAADGLPPGGRAFAGARFWAALGLVALAVAAAALLWPMALANVAYGCAPGAVVLVAVAAVQWLLHERYRRRIVFLPSFSRSRSGSSLLRAGAQRPHGEPSTVDAPPRTGSSANKHPPSPSSEDRGSRVEDRE